MLLIIASALPIEYFLPPGWLMKEARSQERWWATRYVWRVRSA